MDYSLRESMRQISWKKPVYLDVDVWSKDSVWYNDVKQHRLMIVKLIYLTVTGLERFFIVELLSQIMHKLRDVHWNRYESFDIY